MNIFHQLFPPSISHIHRAVTCCWHGELDDRDAQRLKRLFLQWGPQVTLPHQQRLAQQIVADLLYQDPKKLQAYCSVDDPDIWPPSGGGKRKANLGINKISQTAWKRSLLFKPMPPYIKYLCYPQQWLLSVTHKYTFFFYVCLCWRDIVYRTRKHQFCQLHCCRHYYSSGIL